MGRIIVLLICTPWYFQYHATHFLDENEWHKAPPSGYFLRLTPWKPFTQACQIIVLSDHPFFRPCIWSLKMWWSDALLDGVLPQNETRSLGFTCHRWGVSFRFGSLFFLSSLDAHQDKTKPTALVLFGWSIALPQNKFVTFSDFASFYLSVCTMLKRTRSPQNRSKLSA